MEDDGAIGRVTPPRDAHLRDDDDAVEKIVTESVDVYLLAPEDDREIELKDFTIMKPKNNKMHRLVRYYPRCEISYRAVPPPPPEEKIVTSPNGTHTTTITTTHRHNGGFSNPSRNAEVFRLKRRLLKEYYAAIKKDPTFLSVDDETMDARSYSAGSQHYTGSAGQFDIRSTYRRPMSPANWGPSDQDHHQDGGPPSPPPLSMFPRYRRVIVGDEDDVPLTSQLMPKLSWKARANYISSLWPEIAPVDDDEEIMNYYGLEVQIISDEERKKELDAANKAAGDANEANGDRSGPAVVDAGSTSPVKSEPVEAAGEEKEADDEDDDESGPEMTVETRSAAKLKDAEPKILPVATKQDDWVQCDKCQKWRRLASHVNVNDLPATWYCKMNRWDKRFNKCSAPEEKVVVPMKEADLVVYRERRFAQDFLQRIKRMEKAVQQYKYSDMRDDTGERQVVTCVECFKKRALISGMDARKIAQPFVCWMNSWDEMHASCSAPQGPIPPRQIDMQASAGSSSGGGIGAAGDDGKSQSGGTGAKNAGGASSSASKKGSSSKPSSGNGSSSKPAAKRKPSDSSAMSGEKTSGGSGGTDKATSSSGSAKKPKRR